jgi:hypothetical protein
MPYQGTICPSPGSFIPRLPALAESKERLSIDSQQPGRFALMAAGLIEILLSFSIQEFIL